MHDFILRLQRICTDELESSSPDFSYLPFRYHVFQSHEAEQPMEMVIRQDIYEDLQPQGGNQDWCGV